MKKCLGFIPRDGKHINLSVICLAIKKIYDFAPTFAFQLTSSAGFICQSSGNGKNWLDLNDIAAPNVIEHDASLLRKKIYVSTLKFFIYQNFRS